ncbi:MAG: HlyD family efflux transporter periplasmic adaptor subunit [Planctomycetaceae bacterium]|nr:HlyD family efflux transporter periplasmic adaptor subunit [Planctomycetaceae bacterium]
MKKIVFGLLLVAMGIGGYFAWRHWEESRNGHHAEYLELYGNVEIRRTNLGFRVSGRIESIAFEEGDFVKQGEVIATLDRRPNEETLAVAQAQLDRAVAELERMENGSRPQEIEQARATLAEYRASLRLQAAELERAEKLLPTKAISQSEYDAILAQRDEAEAKVRRGAETLNLLEEGSRQEDVAIARAHLAEAKANLDRANTALEDTALLCPNDGVILTRIEEPGAVVQAGQNVVTLSLKDAVWIYVYVPEPELGKVAPGMKAEIYTDTHRAKPYPGQVGSISPEAEFTPKNVETPQLRTNLVYRVRIIAEAPDNGLQQGMPVTVRLLLETNDHGRALTP